MFHSNNEEEFFEYIDKSDCLIKKRLGINPIHNK